ncbi:FAD-dependent pyridine nucleotide-disulfide oxidoreductase [Penicillium expansum]|nr:FAD-dependent pyridine nucleotide-disulfide oxidoreductase [Penicillium expansum]
MAGSTLAIRKMAPSIMQLSSMTRRSMSTSQALRAKPMRSSQSVSRIARRGYADAAPSPAPKPKKRFRALRWAWRLTWLSAIGLTGTVAYSIFDLRQPPDQAPPDPSKKTLVILGTGWGSVSLLKKLDTENYNVIVVSPVTTSFSLPCCPHVPPV